MVDRPSIIGPELKVIGALVSSGDLTIDGNVDGDIRAKGHVTINEGGKIAGNLYAEEVTLKGSVEGGVFAKIVRLGSTCRGVVSLIRTRLPKSHVS